MRADIEHLLGDQVDGELVGVRRRPFPYRSTHSLDELELTWADGSRTGLLLKGCGARAARDVRGVRPRHCFDPYRELWAYENLLRPLGTGAPAFYGTLRLEIGDERLVLERIPGRPLYEVGDMAAWKSTARWAAAMHRRGWAIANESVLAKHVLVQDEGLYRRWLSLARRRAAQEEGSGTLEALKRMQGTYERAIEVLEGRPRTVLHGELYASNVLVQRAGADVSVHPVDWEWTAIGPPELDLAALTAGDWSASARRSLESAYREAADPGLLGGRSAEFERALCAARLVVAVQWLGWADDWTPPAEHARDWLAEAGRAAAGLGE